jgi:hypothetical protein
MLILNVPTSGVAWQQVAMNTITGAWCQWQGYNGACWAIFGDNAYFGGATYVGLAWNGTTDNGSAITTEMQGAFDYMDLPGMLKSFLMVRPTYNSDGSTAAVLVGLTIDYDTTDILGTPSSIPSGLSLWDAGLWDTAVWGAGTVIQKSWQFGAGLGYTASFHMKTSTSGAGVSLSAIDYLFETGGVL